MKERFQWAMIGVGLKGLAFTLNRIGRKDEWLGRALNEFTGVYRFQNGRGTLARHLMLQGGKVKTGKTPTGEIDFTFTLYNPAGIGLGQRPDDILAVVIENKIGQTGNLHYLFQFGFIMSLLERYYKTKGHRKR